MVIPVSGIGRPLGSTAKTLYVVVTVPCAVTPFCVAVNVEPTGRRTRDWPFEHWKLSSASQDTAVAEKLVSDALPSYWQDRPVLRDLIIADTSVAFWVKVTVPRLGPGGNVRRSWPTHSPLTTLVCTIAPSNVPPSGTAKIAGVGVVDVGFSPHPATPHVITSNPDATNARFIHSSAKKS